ncbi:MAG: hypothetical protein CMM01_02440 [Rhodopirellula sp.]|nr:hypothetical protein [Rhodopirellula sp.]
MCFIVWKRDSIPITFLNQIIKYLRLNVRGLSRGDSEMRSVKKIVVFKKVVLSKNVACWTGSSNYSQSDGSELRFNRLNASR